MIRRPTPTPKVLKDLGKKIIPNDSQDTKITRRLGVVDSYQSWSRTAQVRIGSPDSPTFTAHYLSSYTPKVNGSVWVDFKGRDALIIGSQDSASSSDSFYVHTNGNVHMVDPTEDIYDLLGAEDFFTTNSVWVITATLRIGSLPPHTTGIEGWCHVQGYLGPPVVHDSRAYGTSIGTWYGTSEATGSYGVYGWRAQPLLYDPGCIASGSGAAWIGEEDRHTLVASGSAVAWVLTDPGVDPEDVGSAATSMEYLECTVSVNGMKVWDADLEVDGQ